MGIKKTHMRLYYYKKNINFLDKAFILALLYILIKSYSKLIRETIGKCFVVLWIFLKKNLEFD